MLLLIKMDTIFEMNKSLLSLFFFFFVNCIVCHTNTGRDELSCSSSAHSNLWSILKIIIEIKLQKGYCYQDLMKKNPSIVLFV